MRPGRVVKDSNPNRNVNVIGRPAVALDKKQAVDIYQCADGLVFTALQSKQSRIISMIFRSKVFVVAIIQRQKKDMGHAPRQNNYECFGCDDICVKKKNRSGGLENVDTQSSIFWAARWRTHTSSVATRALFVALR